MKKRMKWLIPLSAVAIVAVVAAVALILHLSAPDPIVYEPGTVIYQDDQVTAKVVEPAAERQKIYSMYGKLTEEEYEDVKKDGTKVIKTRKMFPSYVFVEMIVTEKSWFIVRNTPKVTGFLGSSGKGAKPTPLQPYEVDKILGNMGISRMDVDTELSVGTKVKIIAGPFQGMFGTVDSVDLPNGKVNLLVDLFGQETSVEVELSQIENA